jgi:hypothetical protein
VFHDVPEHEGNELNPELTSALLRFRTSAARCGESVDMLSDAQVLEGLGKLVTDDLIDHVKLLAAGLDRVGPEWPHLLDEGRARYAVRSQQSRPKWSLRKWIPWF